METRLTKPLLCEVDQIREHVGLKFRKWIELYSKTKIRESVDYLPEKRHPVTGRKLDLEAYALSDRDLRERFDVTPAQTDIADPG